MQDRDKMSCDMPTASLRMCRHTVRYCYLRNGVIIKTVCTQHYRANGHAAMLRPRWWEFDAVLDLASGITTDLRGIAPEGMTRP